MPQQFEPEPHVLSTTRWNLGKCQSFAPVKPKKEVMSVTIYTDGSCWPNPGKGGWAAIIIHGHGTNTELVGHFPYSTNNRCELTAAIKALEHLRGEHEVTLYSDSKYVINTMQRGRPLNTKRHIKNRDLLDELFFLNKRHKVTWVWVKAHNGDALNEECDRLASKARKNEISKDFP